jgi:hydroxyacylglutathione hydrolase
MLEIVPFVLGPVATNAYLLADTDSGQAAVVDPAWEGRTIAAAAQSRGWEIRQLWYTHAHFDHIGGAAELAGSLSEPPKVAMHPADHLLWKMGGGGPLFGYKIRTGPKPNLDLARAGQLELGGLHFEVRHTPGHTPGSCVFYCRQAQVAFTGDLIFAGSVGRTDLPGGNQQVLMDSIRQSILSLPEETRLHPGHGPATTVGVEKRNNPFLKE